MYLTVTTLPSVHVIVKPSDIDPALEELLTQIALDGAKSADGLTAAVLAESAELEFSRYG